MGLVPAAGLGIRLGGALPKAFVSLAGRPLLSWAIGGLRESGAVGKIVVICGADLLTRAREIAGPHVTVVAGGAERSDSVRAGLAAAGTPRFVLVHDAARCLTPPSLIRSVAAAVWNGAPAVVPALPVVDTIKTVDDHGVVTGTPDRSALRAIQTPQGFDFRLLADAHRESVDEARAVTDDAMLMERAGVPVATVQGDPYAFKITTPLDLALAEAIVASRGANVR